MLGRKKEQGRRVVRDKSAPPVAGVYSYYSAKDKPAEKTIDLGSVGHRLRLVPTLIAAIVIAGSLLFSLTLSARPNVSTLDGQASVYRSSETYADAAADIMNSKFSNKTKLSINTAEFEEELLNRFPELQAAVLRLPIIGRRPNLILDIRPPALLLTSDLRSYVLDSSGTAITEAQALSAETRQGLIVVKDQSNIQVEIGKQTVTTDNVAFVQAVVAQLKAKNLDPESLVLPISSANQLDIRIKGLTYYLKTDLSGDARLQIGSFLAVKEKLERDGVVPSEYVDVRVEEKVFYK